MVVLFGLDYLRPVMFIVKLFSGLLILPQSNVRFNQLSNEMKSSPQRDGPVLRRRHLHAGRAGAGARRRQRVALPGQRVRVPGPARQAAAHAAAHQDGEELLVTHSRPPTHTHRHTCAHTHIHTHARTHAHININTHTPSHIHEPAHTYIHTHADKHRHTHTQTKRAHHVRRVNTLFKRFINVEVNDKLSSIYHLN